jgi:hypothetical protein
MADNVAITAGSGTTVATDQLVGGEHVQKIKIIDGTADSATAIPGDANGLKVQLGMALPAGTANIGDVDVATQPVRAHGTDSIKIGDGTNFITIGTAGADAESNTANRLKTESYNDVFNGTTWDRMKGDLAGNWIRPFPGRAALKSGTATATTTNSTSVIAGTASNYLYITSVIVHNSSTTDTYVTLQDGTGGTGLMVLPVPAKGGAALSLPVPLLVPTSGNGLFFAAGGAVTTMYVSATGYISTV